MCDATITPDEWRTARRLSNRELADISDDWEQPQVDTSKYYQIVLIAYEVDEAIYKKWNGPKQIYEGRYIIG